MLVVGLGSGPSPSWSWLVLVLARDDQDRLTGAVEPGQLSAEGLVRQCHQPGVGRGVLRVLEVVGQEVLDLGRANERVVVVISSWEANGYSPPAIVRWLGKTQLRLTVRQVISKGRSCSSKSS